MKTHILISLGLFFSLFIQAQIGLGTVAPNSSSALEIQSTTQGVLIPRMTKTQLEVITTPAKGLMVYCLDCQDEGLYINIGDGVIATWSDTQGDLLNTLVDALSEILEDSVAGSGNANGIPVSFTQINNTGVTGAVLELLPYYQYDIAAETGFSNPPTTAEIQTIIDAGHDTTTTIVDVTTPTGRIWMDRNVGASQQATSIGDSAAYGDLYQWGRRKDGHELRTSTEMAGPVTATTEGFNVVTSESNWLTPQDNTRWNGTTKGAHDPCPAGYRVPTIAELAAEISYFTPINMAGAFASVLKLTAAGLRQKNVNSIDNEGGIGWYNSSDTSITSLRINPADTSLDNNNKAYGFSIRCIKE